MWHAISLQPLSDSRVDQRPSKGSSCLLEYGGFNYESSAANHLYQFPAPHSIDQSNAANSTTDFQFQWTFKFDSQKLQIST